jgi:hypothetical protein
MQQRLREELRSANSRRVSRADVENDLVLLQKLVAVTPMMGSVSENALDSGERASASQ